MNIKSCHFSVTFKCHYNTKGRIVQTSTKMICNTQRIFYKRLTDRGHNVVAEAYSLSTHLQTRFLMLTCTHMFV
jgi:hypothetical protein